MIKVEQPNLSTAVVPAVATEGGEVPAPSSPSTPQASPEDMAARDYQVLMPKFWNLVEPMSRRQQQRVFKALMEYPLDGGIPRFSYEVEKEAFYLGIQIHDCKFVLMKSVMELTQNKEKLDAFMEDLNKLKEGEQNNDLQVGL